MSYYDLDEILCEEQRVTCIFQQDSYGLGYLDSSSQTSDLHRLAKVN